MINFLPLDFHRIPSRINSWMVNEFCTLTESKPTFLPVIGLLPSMKFLVFSKV